MSTLEQLRKEGEEIGKEIGIEIGEEIGIKVKSVSILLKTLSMQPDWRIKQVADFTEFPISLVKSVKEAYAKKQKTKLLDLLYSRLFKGLELSEKRQKEIKQIVDKYL